MTPFIGARGPRAQQPTPLILPEDAPATLARPQSGKVVLSYEIDLFFLTCTAPFSTSQSSASKRNGKRTCTPIPTGSTPEPPPIPPYSLPASEGTMSHDRQL